MSESSSSQLEKIDISKEYIDSGVKDILDNINNSLIGLQPVKGRIKEIAAYLLVERARKALGLQDHSPTLHMSFTGNPGTGKTTVAMRMAEILHNLGFIRNNHIVVVTRDDLVGQYIGHTAPKTKETLKKAMGGVLFIDEAYYLYRPENERDYGQEAIEILLQIMENNRDDLVVVLAGYADKMEKFFESNPGFRSRITHHIDFPDYTSEELLEIAELIVQEQNCCFNESAKKAMSDYIAIRKTQPHFANARSIRNAVDRIRLRQAGRLFEAKIALGKEELSTITEEDILKSRIFSATKKEKHD